MNTHRCGQIGQSSVMDEAASRAIVVRREGGRCPSVPIVDTLERYKLLKLAESEDSYVTGDAVVYTNVALRAMGLPRSDFIDASTVTNSVTHLVLSDPMLSQSVWNQTRRSTQ